jgi:hypothetical protein
MRWETGAVTDLFAIKGVCERVRNLEEKYFEKGLTEMRGEERDARQNL